MRLLSTITFLLLICAKSSLAQDGLVLAYDFEDAPGDVVLDLEGQGHHAPLENTIDYLAPTWSPGGRRGQGLRFDGVGSLLNLGDPDALDMQNYTISAWVKYHDSEPRGSFEPGQAKDLGRRNHEVIEKIGGYWLNIRLDTGRLRSGGRFGGPDSGCPNPISGQMVRVDSHDPVPANKWTHVATTYDGRYLKVFINGRQQGSIRVPSGMCNSPYPAIIGAQHSDLPYAGSPTGTVKNHFFGRMDEFRIFNRALSTKEIRRVLRNR